MVKPGKESFFQRGNCAVKFAKPVILRGGLGGSKATGELRFIGALNGNTISKEAEAGTRV